MSETRAKRKRKKLLKQQGLDVTAFRGSVDFSTHERKTKTKQEALTKSFSKHKKPFQLDD